MFKDFRVIVSLLWQISEFIRSSDLHVLKLPALRKEIRSAAVRANRCATRLTYRSRLVGRSPLCSSLVQWDNVALVLRQNNSLSRYKSRMPPVRRVVPHLPLESLVAVPEGVLEEPQFCLFQQHSAHRLVEECYAGGPLSHEGAQNVQVALLTHSTLAPNSIASLGASACVTRPACVRNKVFNEW